MNTARASLQHCKDCLTRLRLNGLDGQPKSAAEMAAQDQVMADELTRFSPDAVRAACHAWGVSETRWPKTAELRKLCIEYDAESAPRGGSDNPWPTGEHFADRCNRLGISDREMIKAGMGGYGPIFDAHMRRCDDETFRRGWDDLRRGLKPYAEFAEAA